MDMKKAFISVGIGVIVVTGLIQSGIIDVNEKLGQPIISSSSTAKIDEIQGVLPKSKQAPDRTVENSNSDVDNVAIAKTRANATKTEKILSDPAAIKVKITKTKLGPEKFCSDQLSSGVYVFAVKDIQFNIYQNEAFVETVQTIIGYPGRYSLEVEEFPYKSKDYSFGLLIGNMPNTSEVEIKGICFWAQFNTTPAARNGLSMDKTKIVLAFMPKGG
jgi:hypothetical protein